MVDVETGVDQGGCCNYLIPCIAPSGVCFVEVWERGWGWVSEGFVEEVCITTFGVGGVDVFHECVVETEDR